MSVTVDPAFATLVADLLENHYDPAYRKSTHRNYARLAAARVVQPPDLSPPVIAAFAAELTAFSEREPAPA